MRQAPQHVSVPSLTRQSQGIQCRATSQLCTGGFSRTQAEGTGSSSMFGGFCYVVTCVPRPSVKGRCSSKTGLCERPSSYLLDDQALQVTGKTTALDCKQLQPTGQRRALRRTCKTAEHRTKRRARERPCRPFLRDGAPSPQRSHQSPPHPGHTSPTAGQKAGFTHPLWHSGECARRQHN